MKPAWLAVLGFTMVLPGLGCVSARITLVDERTALENQILGGYEELDRDLQLIASVRSADSVARDRQSVPFLNIRQEALRARQIQQFNRDDVEEMKRLGCLGEAIDGTLALRPCPAASDPTAAERMNRLAESENQARKLILNFVVTTSPDLSAKDLAEVASVYARMHRDEAKSGEWVQEPSGEWRQVE